MHSSLRPLVAPLQSAVRDGYIAGMMLLIFLGLLVPLYISSLFFAKEIYSQLSPLVVLAAFLSFGFLFAWFRSAKWEPDYKTWLIVFLVLVLASISIRLLFANSFEQEFFSDFRSMWDRACLVGNGRNWISPGHPQTERPLPFFIPLTFLFGCQDAVFKIFNVISITISSVLMALIVRDLVGRSAGLVSFAFLSLVPESYFASLIPTHDVPGLLLITLIIYVLHLIMHGHKGKSLTWMLGATISICIFSLALHIQRGLFYPFLVAALLYAPVLFIKGIQKEGALYRAVWFTATLITAALFVGLSSSKLESVGVMYDRDDPDSVYSVWFSYGFQHSMVDGSFASARKFYDRYAVGQSLETNRFYSRAFRDTDLYRDLALRPGNYLERIQRVVRFGRQGGFYYGRLSNFESADQIQINQKFSLWNAGFWHVLSIALLASLFYITFMRISLLGRGVVLLPLAFVSLGIFAIGLIGENQPRYLFFVPWMLVLPMATSIHALANSQLKRDETVGRVRVSLAGGVVLIVGLIIVGMSGKAVLSNSPHLLFDMSSPEISCVGIDHDSCQQARLFPKRSDIRVHSNVTLYHPTGLRQGNSVTAEYTTRRLLPDERVVLSLYVQTPYAREDGRVGFFDKNIYVDGELKRTLNLSDTEDYIYVEIPIVGTGDPVVIGLEVVSKSNNTAASWIRASTTNFRFMAIRADG